MNKTLFLFVIGLLFVRAAHGETVVTETPDGLMWQNKSGATKIYLLKDPSKHAVFHLKIVSKEDLKAVYHTEIGSWEDVIKELEPVKRDGDTAYYEFKHSFSRTTIWMNIEIYRNDLLDLELSRHFYGSAKEASILKNEIEERFP